MYKRKKFYSIFFKKSWGRGATPPARLARREIFLRYKAQEGSRKRPGDGFGVGNPRRGFPGGKLPHDTSRVILFSIDIT